MLYLYIRPNESLLAQNLFELHFRGSSDLGCAFSLAVLSRLPFTVLDKLDQITGGLAYPDKPGEFVATIGSRLNVADCYMYIGRASRGVKIAIDAHPAIRFTRPAQHGTSLSGA